MPPIDRLTSEGGSATGGGDSEDKLTIVIVAHRLSTVRNSDRIFFLKDGVIAERGSHQELMEKRGEYFNLSSVQEARETVNLQVEGRVRDETGAPTVDVESIGVSILMDKKSVSDTGRCSHVSHSPTSNLPHSPSIRSDASDFLRRTITGWIQHARFSRDQRCCNKYEHGISSTQR